MTKASKLLPYQCLADLKTAKQVLIYKPYFALVEMKKDMMDSHPKVWQWFTLGLAYELLQSLKTNPQRVWVMIVEPAFKDS